MEERTKKEIKEQHIDNYRRAILETIKNNTNALVDDDIMSLIRKPPLDSMDLVRSKFLDLAKRNKIILNTDKLSEMIDNYRNELVKFCDNVKSIRIKGLSKKVENTVFKNDNDVIKINKKDFTDINKEIKKTIKEKLSKSLTSIIEKQIDRVFEENVEDEIRIKIKDDFYKYMKGPYQKQLLENIDIKILVKDTTLINTSKEHSDRYLFTLKNSRLLNDLFD